LIHFSLWAATGQNALESSRILVLSASATSTSILKNLVLPGIGHFTILDASNVTPQDAGNNFFLDGPDSIGKNRAEEAVRLLGELNDGVRGKAVKESVGEVLTKQADWVKGFTLVIAHNLENNLLEKLSTLLWEDEAGPPLAVVKSAGFLAEFFIQFRDHSGRLHIAYCRISDQVSSPCSY
jgi:amyloid beta precursor protein binding protein 1